MSRRRLVLVAIAWGSLGCPRSGPIIAPPADDTPATSSQPAATPAPPSSPPATRDPALAELPPWLRALFDAAPRRIYAQTDRYALQRGPGLLYEDTGQLHCRSDGPERLELGKGRIALQSCQTCGIERWREEDEHRALECFIATTEGLWIVPQRLGAADTRRLVVTTPPYLPAVLLPRAESWPRAQPGRPHATESVEIGVMALTVMGEPTDAWCRTDTLGDPYPVRITRCFTPRLGLVAFERIDAAGPSQETHRLIEIAPLPRR